MLKREQRGQKRRTGTKALASRKVLKAMYEYVIGIVGKYCGNDFTCIDTICRGY